MKDREIPLQVFHFDCYWMEAFEWCNFTWDKKTFPDPEEMLKRNNLRPYPKALPIYFDTIRIISIHGRDLKKRTFIGMLWIWILEP